MNGWEPDERFVPPGIRWLDEASIWKRQAKKINDDYCSCLRMLSLSLSWDIYVHNNRHTHTGVCVDVKVKIRTEQEGKDERKTSCDTAGIIHIYTGAVKTIIIVRDLAELVNALTSETGRRRLLGNFTTNFYFVTTRKKKNKTITTINRFF